MSQPRRITNAAQSTDHSRGAGPLLFISPEYSSSLPFNCDGTLLLLLHFGYFGLYDGNGQYLFDCTENGRFEVVDDADPRWSPTDPSVFFYTRGNQIKAYNVKSRTSTVVKTFTEYTAISGKGEGEIARDGAMCLCGDETDLFVYDIARGVKGPVMGVAGPLDAMLFTPTTGDRIVVSWKRMGTGRFYGEELYDRSWNFIRQLAVADGHKDVGYDTNGNEVMIWASSADPVPKCGNAGTGIAKVQMNGDQECAGIVGWEWAMHITCPRVPGKFFVSTYGAGIRGSIYQGDMRGNLQPLVQLQNIVTEEWQEPKVSCSRDGSKLVWIDGSDTWLLDLGTPTAQVEPVLVSPAPQQSLEDTLKAMGFFLVDVSGLANKEWVITYRKVGDKLEANIWEK